MSKERFEEGAKTAMEVVRMVAGHPNVDIEEAAEILVLIGEQLKAAQALNDLQGFSLEEIEGARQFIDALEPASGSQVEGFETVKRVLDLQREITVFSQFDERRIQKTLEGSRIKYDEANIVRVGKLLLALGYYPGYIWGSRMRTLVPRYHDDSMSVLKQRPGKVIKVLGRRIIRPERSVNLADIKFRYHSTSSAHLGNDWGILVYGRENVPEAVRIAKHIEQEYNRVVFVHLESEETRFGDRF